MSERDFRIVNMSNGQLAEHDQVFRRIGEISYRNLGVLSKSLLFDATKALIVDGLRVIPNSGLTVTVESGSGIQRSGNENFPFFMEEDITITMDAASGVARTDIIECQVQSISDKDDSTFVVVDPDTEVVSVESIERDIKYFLNIRKQTDTNTPTSAISGILTGTVAIATTIDLSERYLIGIIDGEDGSFIEIDCRGATPEATTRAEIIANINAGLGRTAANTGVGNVITLEGNGVGVGSVFFLKSPVSDSDADGLEDIFGLSIGGGYYYEYRGENEWFKIAEINMDVATTVITATEIVNLDEKSSWVSGATDVKLGTKILNFEVLDEDDFASDSDTAVPTQQSVKAFILDYIYPIGTTYIQFPGDSDPSTLFGGTWSNVSSEIAGNFMRFEGGNASAFESGTQNDAYGIHNHYQGLALNVNTSGFTSFGNTSAGGANTRAPQLVAISADYKPYTSDSGSSETRPDNETVRKWRRTAWYMI